MNHRLRKIRKTIRESDPNLSPDDEGYHAAVVLLAALEVGQRPKALSEFTGYPIKEIERYSANLRANGVWNRGRTYHSGWDDEKNGCIAFWMDTAVALGYLERAHG